jgi:hypothetical protein
MKILIISLIGIVLFLLILFLYCTCVISSRCSREDDFMYITETTENAKKLIEELEKKDDINKLKFLIYIFGLLNNNQINDKNEANPNLVDDDMKILSLELLGMPENANTIFLQYLAMLHNIMTESKDAYEDNGNCYRSKI